MLPLSHFSEFQENGHIATCEVDGKVKYSIPLDSDSTLSRLIPFVCVIMSIYKYFILFKYLHSKKLFLIRNFVSTKFFNLISYILDIRTTKCEFS